MISIEKLRSVTHVVSHFGCPDGISSALILKDALPNVCVSFMAYNTAELAALKAEPGLLFVDFTPPRDRVQEFVAAGSVVLDHHPTARDIVEAFGDNGFFGLNEKNECGAWLAYEHVWKPLCELRDELVSENYPRATSSMVEDFATLAAIRDTWKKDDPRWRAACEQAALLLFWPFDDLDLKSDIFLGSDLGKVLVDKQLSAAQRSLKESYRFVTTKGTCVCMFQGVSTTSDAAEKLERDEKLVGMLSRSVSHDSFGKELLPGVESLGNRIFPLTEEESKAEASPVGRSTNLVVGFHYRSDAGKLQLQFSMRSHTGYDCAAFAKAHGGGGHKAAAGFTVEVSPELSGNPYELFHLYLDQWESGQ